MQLHFKSGELTTKFNFLQKCTCLVSVQDFSDFRMRSASKSVKFSAGNAQDSLGFDVIREGKFDNNEI